MDDQFAEDRPPWADKMPKGCSYMSYALAVELESILDVPCKKFLKLEEQYNHVSVPLLDSSTFRQEVLRMAGQSWTQEDFFGQLERSLKAKKMATGLEARKLCSRARYGGDLDVPGHHEPEAKDAISRMHQNLSLQSSVRCLRVWLETLAREGQEKAKTRPAGSPRPDDRANKLLAPGSRWAAKEAGNRNIKPAQPKPDTSTLERCSEDGSVDPALSLRRSARQHCKKPLRTPPVGSAPTGVRKATTDARRSRGALWSTIDFDAYG